MLIHFTISIGLLGGRSCYGSVFSVYRHVNSPPHLPNWRIILFHSSRMNGLCDTSLILCMNVMEEALGSRLPDVLLSMKVIPALTHHHSPIERYRLRAYLKNLGREVPSRWPLATLHPSDDDLRMKRQTKKPSSTTERSCCAPFSFFLLGPVQIVIYHLAAGSYKT
jgi:hypothetical protein